MKILFISIPAFVYGNKSPSSVVERLSLTVQSLKEIGHHCSVLVPIGSDKGEGIIEIKGELHPNFETASKFEYFMSPGSVLMNMLEYARTHQSEYDFIISVAQDFMCFWSQPYFKTPFLIIPSTPKSLKEADDLLLQRYRDDPLCVGFLTHSQKKVFLKEVGLDNINDFILWEPLEKTQYTYTENKDYTSIFWAGRIALDKGVENVAKVCKSLGKKLILSGTINDQNYLYHILKNYDAEYIGILNRHEMSKYMSRSPVFFQLQSDSWVEAFGRTTAEALLSGTPLIAFDNGANSELINEGIDGYIVKDLNHAIQMYESAIKLNPLEIRALAEKKFDKTTHAKNIESWLLKINHRLN